MIRISTARDLHFESLVHRVPGAFFTIGRGLRLLHRFSAYFPISIALKSGAMLASLLQDAIGDPDVIARIRVGVLRLEPPPNLAIPQTPLLVKQQSQPARIAIRPDRAILHHDPAPAGMRPAR